tara:strand:+ start:329 stop:544 length:216 start_codon:yes stop_codon:yes gene_type:complete
MVNLLHGDGHYERVSKTFSYKGRLEDKMIAWIMEYVRASPLNYKLFLKDGEVVEVTLNADLSRTINIQYKL